MRWVASLCLALLVSGGASGCKRQTTAAGPVTLAIVTDLQGTTEPCGCTSHPLGGLDRLAQRLEALAPAPWGLLLVGNTFTPPPPVDPPPGWLEQERARAAVVTQILARLQPLAV